jgi:hypothetical protein
MNKAQSRMWLRQPTVRRKIKSSAVARATGNKKTPPELTADLATGFDAFPRYSC